MTLPHDREPASLMVNKTGSNLNVLNSNAECNLPTFIKPWMFSLSASFCSFLNSNNAKSFMKNIHLLLSENGIRTEPLHWSIALLLLLDRLEKN